MLDEIREELCEVKDNLFLVKAGMQTIDNKIQVDNALFAIIRSLDHITEEIDDELNAKNRPTMKGSSSGGTQIHNT